MERIPSEEEQDEEDSRKTNIERIPGRKTTRSRGFQEEQHKDDPRKNTNMEKVPGKRPTWKMILASRKKHKMKRIPGKGPTWRGFHPGRAGCRGFQEERDQETNTWRGFQEEEQYEGVPGRTTRSRDQHGEDSRKEPTWRGFHPGRRAR
uniref:Uncharacterized protein LOC114333068 n=1 Tax=Diabrotica virgifera virgifera TaxID=50390 RepID=A0A6P7G271_DIAVI